VRGHPGPAVPASLSSRPEPEAAADQDPAADTRKGVWGYLDGVDLSGLGKALLMLAVVLAVVGGAFLLMGQGVLPRLPGDLSFGTGNVRVFVPIGTSILVSIVLTILLNLLARR
jgi:hypothetical protein